MTVDLSGTTVLAMRSLWEQKPLIEKAKEFGAKVVAIDEDEDAEGLEMADESVVVSGLRDIEPCYQAAVEHDVDAVVTDQCDYSLFTISYIGERLGLPSVSLESVQKMTNKKRMREAADGTVPQPEHSLVVTLEEARESAEEIGYPCVLKPVDNRGGFGVSRVDRPDELPTAFYDALKNSHAREVLVERFVEGTPVSVDGYCVDGEHRSLAFGMKNTSMGSLHPNLEITYPAQLSEEEIARVERANDSTAEALGVEGGATHAEYILTDEKAYLLEFQNRGGGVHTSARIVPAVTGFDVSKQLLADATDQRTGQEDGEFRMEEAAVMRFLDFEPGYVEEIKGADAIRERVDVLTFRLYFEGEEEIEDFSAFTDSHGVIIGTGSTPKAARSNIESALEELELVYR